jgi:hypothetical protein
MANLKNSSINDTGRIKLPTGLESQRPAAETGRIRFNTNSSRAEFYNSTAWETPNKATTTVPTETPGRTEANPITTSGFSGGIAGKSYWIRPNASGTASLAEYSGDDFKGTNRGYFRWFRTPDQGTATVNLIDRGLQWNMMIIEKEGGVWHSIGYNTYQTFNGRDSNDTGTIGTRIGYRVFFGGGGSHGIYNTAQRPCSWGDSSGAIGAGWDGSTCGSYPNNLIMGEGTSGSANYANRGGTWSYWFSF